MFTFNVNLQYYIHILLLDYYSFFILVPTGNYAFSSDDDHFIYIILSKYVVLADIYSLHLI